MRVSKLLGFLILAIIIGVGFFLTPITAAEHPWAEDPVWDDFDTIGSPIGNNNNGDDDGGEDGLGSGTTTFGSSLFWWNLLYDAIDYNANQVNPVSDPVESVFSRE